MRQLYRAMTLAATLTMGCGLPSNTDPCPPEERIYVTPFQEVKLEDEVKLGAAQKARRYVCSRDDLHTEIEVNGRRYGSLKSLIEKRGDEVAEQAEKALDKYASSKKD